MHVNYAKIRMLYAPDLAKAKAHLEPVLRKYPQWVDGYNQVGKIALLEGDIRRAETLCRRSIELNPYSADGYLGLGVIFTQQNRVDEALPCLHNSIRFDPYSAENHIALGIALMSALQFADANRQFDRAVELDPSSGRAWFNRAYGLMAENPGPENKTKAIEYLSKSAGVRSRPDAPDRSRERFRDARRSGVIHADDRPARGRSELRERPLELGRAAVVAFQMIGLDVVDHRHRWCQREKRLVVLVRFDDVERRSPHAGVAAPGRHTTAHETRRVPPRRRERLRAHRRRRRLAVCPRDGDHCAPGHHRSQRVGTPQHRDAKRAGTGELGVVGGDRRRHHHSPRTLHVPRIVPLPDGHTERLQVGSTRSVVVTTSYGRPAQLRQQRQGTHPRSSDAHEVDRSGIAVGCKQGHLWEANIGILRNLEKTD